MPKVIKMGGPRALDCLKDHNTSPDRVSKTSSAKRSKNPEHKNKKKEHVPISHFKKRARSRSSSKQGRVNPKMKIVVQEMLHVHPELKKVVQQMLLAKFREKSMLNKDAKKKGIILFMRNKCTKKVVQKLVKNQNPDRLCTQLYLLVKKIRHSGPSSELIPTKMLKRGCSVWKTK